MHGFESIIDELEDNIYQINYRESINKLNDIENVKINKFEISKILTRLNIASKNMSNTISMDIVKEILPIADNFERALSMSENQDDEFFKGFTGTICKYYIYCHGRE